MYLPPFISKLSYAVLLSPIQLKQLTSDQLYSVLLKKSNYRRIFSFVHLIDAVIPGIAQRSSCWLCKNNHFPWAPVDMQLIASGSGAAVLKINWKGDTKVLRIYRRSIGRLSCELLEIAKYYKRNYVTLLSWYGTSLDLVLPMEFMVLQGMPLVGPVAASLQPYLHGEKQDFFDFCDDELLVILERNRCAREQFLLFARQTMRQWDEQKVCFDFLGRENLMMVRQGGEYRLHIVDVGIFKLDFLKRKYPGIMAQMEQRMDRLSALYRRVNEIKAGNWSEAGSGTAREMIER